MKIFITGITGFIGSSLLPKLLRKDFSLTCYIRDKEKKEELEAKGCKVIIGELFEYEKLLKNLKKIDVVIHLVGIGNVSQNSKEAYASYKQVNVEGTKILAEACAKCRVKKFIYLSSIAAMGSKCQGVMNEESLPAPIIPYEKSKLESEQVLQDISKKSSLNVFILRPTWVIGKEDRGKDILKLAKMVKTGFVPLVNGGKFYTMIVAVDSVSEAILCCIKKDIKGCRVYIISDEKSYQQRELVNMIADSLIKKRIISKYPLIIYLPKFLLLIIASLVEFITKILRIPPFISRKRVYSMSQDRHYSIKRAVEELGFKPISIQKAIEEEIDWLHEEGKI